MVALEAVATGSTLETRRQREDARHASSVLENDSQKLLLLLFSQTSDYWVQSELVLPLTVTGSEENKTETNLEIGAELALTQLHLHSPAKASFMFTMTRSEHKTCQHKPATF